MKWKRTWEWPEEGKKDLIEIPESSSCPYCNRMMYKSTNNEGEYKATRDHKIPRSRGGGNELDNMEVVCARCNVDKASMTKTEFLYLIEKGDLAPSYISYEIRKKRIPTRREKAIELRHRILRDRAKYRKENSQ